MTLILDVDRNVSLTHTRQIVVYIYTINVSFISNCFGLVVLLRRGKVRGYVHVRFGYDVAMGVKSSFRIPKV